MNIQVTQKHIDTAKLIKHGCPAALAIQEAYPKSAVIMSSFVVFVDDVRFNLFYDTVNAIKHFRAEYQISPFSFDMVDGKKIEPKNPKIVK